MPLGPQMAGMLGAAGSVGGLVPGEQDVIDLGPSLWMDASRASSVKSDDSGEEADATNGQDVTKWISREGSAIELVQTCADEQPIFNTPNTDFNDYSTITFDSTADTWLGKDARYVDTTGNVGSIFYVGKELNGDTNARIVNWATNGQASIGTNYLTAHALYVYAPLAQFGPVGDQLSVYMAVVSIDGSSSYCSMNEGAPVTFTASAAMTADSGNTSVGGYGGTSENSSTVAAEYIIFNTALIPDDVAKVETYLKNKYDGF